MKSRYWKICYDWGLRPIRTRFDTDYHCLMILNYWLAKHLGEFR